MRGSPEHFASYMKKADIKKWSRLVRTAHVPKL
jgi:hypothetical protein